MNRFSNFATGLVTALIAGPAYACEVLPTDGSCCPPNPCGVEPASMNIAQLSSATTTAAAHGAGTPAWAMLAYLVAGVFFILALRGLSSPATSRTGNRNGMIGMALAVGTTLVTHDIANIVEILIAVAIGGAIGAGEVLHGVGEVGVGIAQAGGIAGVADPARGRELDLHQPDGAAAADEVRLIAALAHDDAMHQRFRHAIGAGMGRDHLGVFGFAGESRLWHNQSGREQRDDA